MCGISNLKPLVEILELTWLGHDACQLLHAPKEAGRLRCCSRSWRGLGRLATNDNETCGPVQCTLLSLKTSDVFQTVLTKGLVCWDNLSCLDIANVLDWGPGGLRGDMCCAEVSISSTKLSSSEICFDRFLDIMPQLRKLSRLSIVVVNQAGGFHNNKLAAPNCLQAVGSLVDLQQLYIEVDHGSLEVALFCALNTLRSLKKFWLNLLSRRYDEHICGALARRLPESLEVFGLMGAVRQVRAILEYLGPKGGPDSAITLAKLQRLDLSVNPDGSGGRFGDPSGTGVDIPANVVWRILKRGAPNLESICLWGALSWYPPVGDVWFSHLLRLVEKDFGSKLRVLDVRANRIREDVVARVRERLQRRLGSDFCLLWDGEKVLNC